MNLHSWIFSRYCGLFCWEKTPPSPSFTVPQRMWRQQPLGDETLYEASGSQRKDRRMWVGTLELVLGGLQSSTATTVRSHSKQTGTLTARILCSTTLNILQRKNSIGNSVGFVHFPSQKHARRGNIPMNAVSASALQGLWQRKLSPQHLPVPSPGPVLWSSSRSEWDQSLIQKVITAVLCGCQQVTCVALSFAEKCWRQSKSEEQPGRHRNKAALGLCLQTPPCSREAGFPAVKPV